MSISKCIVRLKDCHNTEHSVEVYAVLGFGRCVITYMAPLDSKHLVLVLQVKTAKKKGYSTHLTGTGHRDTDKVLKSLSDCVSHAN